MTTRGRRKRISPEDLGPYSNFRMAIRLELTQRTGVFAALATALAEEGASLGAVDIVSATRTKVIRDITFDVKSETHGEQVLQRLNALPDVRVIAASDQIFLMHLGGKIRVDSKYPIKTRNALSMVYTPGVSRIVKTIAKDGIDAWPICLNDQDPDKIIRTVCAIAPGFGGIQLEDISAPRCYEIERRLQESLDIPVMHDDQQGTAVVILAALTNALKSMKGRLDEITIVVVGLGAAGTACCKLLLAAGVTGLKGCDTNGLVLDQPIKTLNKHRQSLQSLIHYHRPTGTLQDALKGAHVVIGLSTGNVLQPKDLALMAKDPIVFALANPDPEITPQAATPFCRVYASGRSDYPNQCNNLLSFPGIFRGSLDIQAKTINEPMLLAAARALANVIPESAMNEEYILPSVFDKRVVPQVAKAVAHAAIESGVARRRKKEVLEPTT
jgi:malate dehydrogenase (oxaloacetate-decarboxylating)